MVFFITFLRALAACFITNAHYTGIYPSDIIANGGLIGDVLFFSISGYCLFHIKQPLSVSGFGRWYGKRLWRVYPPVIIITLLYILTGAYQINHDRNVIWWFIYPTYYHFVASIIILYIPFFFIMRISYLQERIGIVMAVIGVLWLFVYFLIYDRSYYHIDNVYEPMIRFLFMESMLLGAWFRKNDYKYRNRFKLIYPIVTVVVFLMYFASKLLFSRMDSLAPWQFFNQIIIFVLLFCVFRTFSSLDAKLEMMPTSIKKFIQFISEMTLEIYVVQYVLIRIIRDWKIVFPLNWIILTLSIGISAFILHKISRLLYGIVNKVILRI